MPPVSSQLLPEPLRKLEPGATYPVEVGEALVDLAAEFDRHLRDRIGSR